MLVKKKKRHHFKLSDDEIYCLEIHSFIPRVKTLCDDGMCNDA